VAGFPAVTRYFLFCTESRAALGPTQPPSYLVNGALSQGVMQLGPEADHAPPLARSIMNKAVILLPRMPSWLAEGELHLRTLLPF
jgi:hypothetical protein